MDTTYTTAEAQSHGLCILCVTLIMPFIIGTYMTAYIITKWAITSTLFISVILICYMLVIQKLTSFNLRAIIQWYNTSAASTDLFITNSNPTPFEKYQLQFLDILYPNVVKLQLSNIPNKYLPKKLPPCIRELRLKNIDFGPQFPFELPDTITALYIDDVDLNTFPEFPPNLEILYISVLYSYGPIALPSFPPSLFKIHLFGISELTAIPELPQTLEVLDVKGIPNLRRLPNLPDTIMEACICNNDVLYIEDKKLHAAFNIIGYWENIEFENDDADADHDAYYYDPDNDADGIGDLSEYENIDFIINTINTINALRRAEDFMKIVNKNDIIRELYMRRMMHPDRLSALKNNETIDVDEFMTRYVDSL